MDVECSKDPAMVEIMSQASDVPTPAASSILDDANRPFVDRVELARVVSSDPLHIVGHQLFGTELSIIHQNLQVEQGGVSDK